MFYALLAANKQKEKLSVKSVPSVDKRGGKYNIKINFASRTKAVTMGFSAPRAHTDINFTRLPCKIIHHKLLKPDKKIDVVIFH